MWQSHLFGESLSKIITGTSLSRRPNAATESDLRQMTGQKLKLILKLIRRFGPVVAALLDYNSILAATDFPQDRTALH